MRRPPLGKQPASERPSLNFAVQIFCPAATTGAASSLFSSIGAGGRFCRRSTISLRTASGSASANGAAKDSATAARLRKRIQELHELVDLFPIEDAVAAEGRHDGCGIGR